MPDPATVQIRTGRLAERLVSRLGPTLVAALMGRRDRQALTHPPFSRQEAARLEAAEEAWWTVVDADGPDVARAWFIGHNARLDQTPILALRGDRGPAVISAAQAYSADAGGD